jgi:hypothetical protein
MRRIRNKDLNAKKQSEIEQIKSVTNISEETSKT